ncbi:hypothetical protein [Acidovorax sp. SUPP3334]|uniref:hypothetical protein n=1 Tax=Acidovorax sp. SUPP3334 TaxID=2920881 RepID=UPI0023DE2B56|nr:hypothetical protein [Acidovorax sp. SUPP3334]GKT22552.1 hypothetical protein AVHM3334_08805 [Acidovorax sp. SUPP3334]
MTKAPEKLACPVCSAELTFEQLLGRMESDRTFDRLTSISVPLGNLVMQYLTLFTPPSQRLTNTKKLRLIGQLLPGLEAKSITHKGREWAAPLAHWAQAIEQMLTARSMDRLTLPMTNHSYLYTILAGMADKLEGQAEQQHEQELRTGPRRAATHGPAAVGDVLQQAAPSAAPAPRPAAAAPAPAGLSPTVRAMRAQIDARKKGEQP